MDIKEVRALVKLMHKEGIVSYKTPELELLVQPKQKQVRRKRAKQDDVNTLLSGGTFKGYTDEEVLGWSAPLAENNSEG